MLWHGKMKALTFSYDDGVCEDKELIEIFNKYGMKATFNLNSGIMTKSHTWTCNDKIIRRMDVEEIKGVYDGHEISSHFLTHPFPFELSDEELEYEVHQDILNLEELFKCKIIGSAYPYGQADERIINVLKKNGLKYGRDALGTFSFEVQTDLMRFKPTCHHGVDNLMELGEQFLSAKPDKPMLFYVWGHSYEFKGYDNWNVIEDFCKLMSGKDDIFYGTNAQVFGLCD